MGELNRESASKTSILAEAIQQAISEEVSSIARLFADKPSHELFGQSEFDLRTIAHRIAAKALEVTLAGKKTATKGPA
jgi:hypothetical protein